MLRKLMKHEFRATVRIMLPMLLLTLVSAVGANLSARKLLNMENSLVNALGVLLLIAFVAAIMGVCILSFALMVQRFYTNLLQDEGYLMMTLPVSAGQHVLSKMIISVVWFAVTTLTVMIAFVVLVFDQSVLIELFPAVSGFVREVIASDYTTHAALSTVELLLLLIAGCMGLCLQIYAALSIGCSFTHHKIVLSIAAYFAMYFILQLIYVAFGNLMTSMGVIELFNGWMMDAPQTTVMHVLLLLATVASLMHSAVFYAITTHFLKNRLNLN